MFFLNKNVVGKLWRIPPPIVYVLQVLLAGMMSGVPALHWQCGDVYCAFFFLLLLEKPPPIRKHDSVSRFFSSSFSDNREAHPQSFSPCTYIHFRCPFKSYGVNMFHRSPDFTAVFLCESRCGGYGWFFLLSSVSPNTQS